MAEFFSERALIGLSQDTDLSIDRSFPYKGEEIPTEVNVIINDEKIDKLMQYKPASDPDPDS